MGDSSGGQRVGILQSCNLVPSCRQVPWTTISSSSRKMRLINGAKPTSARYTPTSTHPCRPMSHVHHQRRLCIQRKPMVQGLIAADVVLRQQFRCPHPTVKDGTSHQLRRALQARHRFVPWANGKHDRVFVPKFTPPSSGSSEEPPAPPPEVALLHNRHPANTSSITGS